MLGIPLLPFLLAATLSSDSVPAAALSRGTGQGVAFSVHRQPAVPLVALRLALLANDPPGYAGAGHLYQHLVFPRLREQASLVGARVQIERTADAVVFTVVGPSAELPFMSEILRRTLQIEPPSEVALLSASRELAEERLAEWETAERHVRSTLRLRLFPNQLSAAGTEASAARLAGRGALGDAWARMYRPDRLSITAVGDVTLAQVEQAFGTLPSAVNPRRGAELRDTVSSAPLAPAEATQAWLGLGYSVLEEESAVLSVATRVVGDRLQQRLGASSRVVAEHWWTHQGQALVLVVSTRGPQLAATQRTLGAAISAAATGLTEAQVEEAAKAIRRDLRFFSRTPERMASFLGQFSDRSGDPGAAQRFYDRLDAVTAEEVRDLLSRLLERSPSRVEIPPQRLIRR